MSASQSMSRATRTSRGGAAAIFATVCAAASHLLGGGAVSWFAVFATALVAWPLCIALAGAIGSVWRIGVAVGASQFLFHWSFGSLNPPGSLGALVTHAHAPSLQLPGLDTAQLSPAATSSTLMWITHLLAALATTAILAYGERAVIALGRTLRRVVWGTRIRSASCVWPQLRTLASAVSSHSTCFSRMITGTVSHRGPPCTSALSYTHAH